MGNAKRTRVNEAEGRKRLAQLLDALPVFAGFITPDGELAGDFDSAPGPLQIARAGSAEWLWDLPAFAGLPGAAAQLRTLCARAADGHAVQVEMPYLTGPDEARLRRRGLLSLTPRVDEDGLVAELAITLVDCDRHGLPPRSLYQPSRIDRANARLDRALDVAQAVIRASRGGEAGDDGRDALAARLHVVAGTADALSQMERDTLNLSELTRLALQDTDALGHRADHHTLTVGSGDVPMEYVPLLSLLIHEWAASVGCWSQAESSGEVQVSWESRGDTARLRWLETGATSDAPTPAFLTRLTRDLLPALCDADAQHRVGPNATEWIVTLPIAVEDAQNAASDFGRFDGGYTDPALEDLTFGGIS